MILLHISERNEVAGGKTKSMADPEGFGGTLELPLRPGFEISHENDIAWSHHPMKME